jgi:hypothetical protein
VVSQLVKLYCWQLQVLQAPLLHRLFLDLVSFGEHLLGSAKINIRRGEIVQGLVLARVVVVVHKAGDLGFKFGGEEIILQVHNVLHRTVVAFNLALGHRMVGSRAGMFSMPVL